MDAVDDMDETFESERARLTGIAYRILSSVTDAEDVVQDAWMTWERCDRDEIRNPAAWLTTVTSRLAIDQLRAQRRRREDYVGPWLPDPIATAFAVTTDTQAHLRGPEQSFDLVESLELGFLVVLDALGPLERAVFVLADLFAVPYAEIAVATDRTPEACRQIASRARRKVRDGRADRRPADEGLLGDLVGAIALGDAERVISLLSPDIVLLSDGGPLRHAARRPVVHPDRVARLLVNLSSRLPVDGSIAIEQVNGAPALVLRNGADTIAVSAERRSIDGAIERIHLMMNPDKVIGVDRRVDLI